MQCHILHTCEVVLVCVCVPPCACYIQLNSLRFVTVRCGAPCMDYCCYCCCSLGASGTNVFDSFIDGLVYSFHAIGPCITSTLRVSIAYTSTHTTELSLQSRSTVQAKHNKNIRKITLEVRCLREYLDVITTFITFSTESFQEIHLNLFEMK